MWLICLPANKIKNQCKLARAHDSSKDRIFPLEVNEWVENIVLYGPADFRNTLDSGFW